jgi:hypothetical protein
MKLALAQAASFHRAVNELCFDELMRSLRLSIFMLTCKNARGRPLRFGQAVRGRLLGITPGRQALVPYALIRLPGAFAWRCVLQFMRTLLTLFFSLQLAVIEPSQDDQDGPVK